MSLFLGKTGRRVVSYAVTHPRINRALNTFGRVAHKATFGKYRIGLTRLAYRISEQLSVGESITISDGKISKDGNIIAEDKLLKTGKAMDKFPVREPLTTPEGMVAFLRHIYLKPEHRGIKISSQFADRKINFIDQINYINQRLQINLDSGISLYVQPTNIINRFCRPFVFLGTTLPLFSFVFGFKSIIEYTFFSDSIASSLPYTHSSPFLVFISRFAMTVVLVAPLATTSLVVPLLGLKHLSSFLGSYKPLFRMRSSMRSFTNPIGSSGAVIILSSKDSEFILVHEYIHFLKDFGFIENDIIANSCMLAIRHEQTGQLGEREKNCKKGRQANPYQFILETRLTFPLERPETYRIGDELYGLSDQLAEKTGNPEDKWEFLRIVSQSKTKEDLLEKLKNSQFREFFTASEN